MKDNQSVEKSPIYQFFQWLDARDKGNCKLEAIAQQKLAACGVSVEAMVSEQIKRSKNLLLAWQGEAPELLEMGVESVVELIAELTRFIKTWSAVDVADLADYDPEAMREAQDKVAARLDCVRGDIALLRAALRQELD